MTPPLFHNENFTIDPKYMYNANLGKSGVRYIREILSNDICFKDLSDMITLPRIE